MIDILKTMIHLFNMANPIHIIFVIGIYLFTLLLMILHKKWKNEKKKVRIWRGICCVPLGLCVIHFWIFCMGPAWQLLIRYYVLLYIVAFTVALWGQLGRGKYGYPIMAGLTNVVVILLGIYFSTGSHYVANYTKDGWAESFSKTCDYMEKHYILKEWKEINFDALKTELLPQVVKAEQENDFATYYAAVEKLVYSLHDGHANIALYEGDPEVVRLYVGVCNDYGFCMVTLDDGKTIAVNVEENCEAMQQGIIEGTVITKWDGTAIEKIEVDMAHEAIGVECNEEMIRPIIISGMGGESVRVSFLDENGNEKTVIVNALQFDVEDEIEKAFAYSGRKRATIGKLVHVNERETNYESYMLTEDCGYLKLTENATNDIEDFKGYLTGDHSYARGLFREKLIELRKQGMTKLVIDIRGNGGGYDEIGCALADLLSEEEFLAQSFGIVKDGKFQRMADHYVKADGEFADLEVVALTNMYCGSAGDGTALYLSKLSNVTVAGISDSNGCNQEMGGECYLSGGIIVTFPTGLVLNESGEPNIDIKADRISRNPNEVYIPFDREAAMQIFSDEGDYELEWAIEYLNQKEKRK